METEIQSEEKTGASTSVQADNLCPTSNLEVAKLAHHLGGPLQMSWTVSRLCNFHCHHCFNNSGPNPQEAEPPREVIVDRIIEAKPYNVCLCGGEPFYWDDLNAITSRLRDGGIPIISLVTNGYLATAEALKEVTDSGLNALQVSLDGYVDEEHAKLRPQENSWNRAKQCIEDALKIDAFRWVSVSWVPNRDSIDHFEDYVRMVSNMGVRQIRVQPLMASGRASRSFDRLRPSAEQYAKLVGCIIRLRQETAVQEGLTIEWGDPLEHLWFYTKTPAIPQQLSIQSKGWYELSPYIPVLLGDAAKHSVQEFWDRSPKDMCNFPIFQKMADQLVVLDGMRELKPNIYYEEPIFIDVFDDENWQLAEETSDANILIEYARTKGYYDELPVAEGDRHYATSAS